MVWAGTQSYVLIGKSLWVESLAYDADAETGTSIDLHGFGFQPTKVSMVVVRTAGATAGIDVDVQGSVDNSNFVQLTNVTAKDTVNTADVSPYRYFRAYVTTVGAANTLSIYFHLAE